MRLLLAAGGTGGHVIPALVVAQELSERSPSHQVLFAGTVRGVENKLVPAAGFPLERVEVGALQGQPPATRLLNFLRLPRALWQASRLQEKFLPDVVLGVGGYAAGPVMLAGGIAGIPLAALEPNAFPGLANRWVAPYVTSAFLAFPQTASYFASAAPSVVGVPVRREFFAVQPKRHHPPFTVLIFGGSQGARSLNRAAVEALPLLARNKENLFLVHQTGQSEYNAVKEAYEKHSLRAEVLPYIEKMAEAFAGADMVVCRAGANTLAELAAAGRAAVLVPFPSAANQHQLRNARALADIGAARLIPDRELSGERLFAVLQELLGDPQGLEQMESHIRSTAHPEAASRIVDELERLARLHSGGRS